MSDTILIVDDSLTVRMDLIDAFATTGIPVTACGSVAEAREALKNPGIGVVILDVLLPDGDGVELLREIRSASPNASPAVLMLSTEAEVKDRVRALQTGADEYVGKPYDTGYLVAKAKELLRSRRPTTGAARRTVLVIDDSITYRETLRDALAQAEYTVFSAGSGEEGLQLAAVERPDAIVVDGVLPGMDGPAVIRHVRLDAALRGTPCLLLTSSEERSDELRALDAGADAFVRKDEDVEVIMARLAAIVRGSAAKVRDTVSLLGPRKILAVDDSQTYLHELSEALRADGYDVIPARSGEEALELLAVQPVDCILLDLIMPGMGGKEACSRIKSAPVVRDIPLIMLTALENREAMLEGLGAGADDYISKSGEFEVLRARVRAQIRRKQFEDENRQIREELLRSELVASEARAARELAEAKAAMTEELERKNKELESFSYSVSHDLRAPLRTIDGFSQALLEDCGDRLNADGKDSLQRIRAAAQRMGNLIDDLLALSRTGRADMHRHPVDLTALGHELLAELRHGYPERDVVMTVDDAMTADGDSRLLRAVLQNLIGNAWKYTARQPVAHIRFGMADEHGQHVFFVRDDGAGFDMTYVDKLFGAFQRLHSAEEFEGNGIGLATVQRIINRHGGRVWAEGAVDAGATFYFTLPSSERRGERNEGQDNSARGGRPERRGADLAGTEAEQHHQ